MSFFENIQRHAGRHAMTYLLALLLGCAASFNAFYDVFSELTKSQMTALGIWQIGAMLAKCLAPFCTTVVAFLMKSPLHDQEKMNSPFPPKP